MRGKEKYGEHGNWSNRNNQEIHKLYNDLDIIVDITKNGLE